MSISFPSFPELPGEECERLLISGYLPPQSSSETKKSVFGFNVQWEGDSDGAYIFRDFDNITFGTFLLDSMVWARKRLSTYKWTKKWSKEEDIIFFTDNLNVKYSAWSQNEHLRYSLLQYLLKRYF
jgi:hypothetical protein